MARRGRSGRRGNRRSRWLVIVAATAILTATLTGCLGIGSDRSGDTSQEGDDPQFPEALAFEGCWELLGSWELSHDEVAPYLPPGFTSTALFPAEDTTGVNATMDVIAITCPQPWEATVLFPWIYVIPPDELVDPAADAFRLTLPCIGDASLVDVLRAWGAPCHVAEAEIQTIAETPAAATWAFEARGSQLDVRLEGTGAATGLRSDEPVFQQFHAVDREVCATTLLELEDHVHWQGANFEVTVDGEAPFPLPEEPGTGLLAMPAFTMTIEPSSLPLASASEDSGCP